MANKLGLDLTGKKVVMEGNGTEEHRTVEVLGGFGAVPFTSGSALHVRFQDGSEGRMDGWEVERLA